MTIKISFDCLNTLVTGHSMEEQTMLQMLLVVKFWYLWKRTQVTVQYDLVLNKYTLPTMRHPFSVIIAK